MQVAREESTACQTEPSEIHVHLTKKKTGGKVVPYFNHADGQNAILKRSGPVSGFAGYSTESIPIRAIINNVRLYSKGVFCL
ncbi:hypothetical protein [Ralstonia pickettii]|uniref:hypothetical protein n=1 Tax=Ralstonia pickettii TaxID=329 RepID=UPI0008188B6C|nr:hypothetical protein [Ralstonia pickettii]OCS47045.1 hypothetical protein BEK67_04290 [Ralstonia pickettii]